MKIAILTGWYPNSVIDEDGLSVRNQALALRTSGLDIAVISVSLMKQFLKKGKFIPKAVKSQYGILSQYTMEGFHPSRKGAFLFKHYNEQVKKPFDLYVTENGLPDLIHVHNYTTGLAALQLKLKHGIPYVLTEHSTSFMDKWLPKSHIPFIKEIFENAEKVYGVSQALANSMQEFASKPIEVMSNFIDTQLFCPPRVQPAFDDGPQLITVSTFTERKQIPLLIEAMPGILKIYSKAQLNIVGYGPDEEKLKALVAKLNLLESVIFKGAASQAEVAMLMQENHLFVCASHTETFGVVYVEALACGLPVVAIDSGGVRDMIVDGVNGFIVNDESTLSDKIIEALDKYQDYNREEMVRSCVEAFGILSNVERHIKLYTSICEVYN